jgi:hypothetical protein
MVDKFQTHRDRSLLTVLQKHDDPHERQRALVVASLLRREDPTPKEPAVGR